MSGVTFFVLTRDILSRLTTLSCLFVYMFVCVCLRITYIVVIKLPVFFAHKQNAKQGRRTPFKNGMMKNFSFGFFAILYQRIFIDFFTADWAFEPADFRQHHGKYPKRNNSLTAWFHFFQIWKRNLIIWSVFLCCNATQIFTIA